MATFARMPRVRLGQGVGLLALQGAVMLKMRHLDRALRQEQMQERAAWKATNEPHQAPRWRRCEFCGCNNKCADACVLRTRTRCRPQAAERQR
jgi:hypothetical protein